MVLFVVLCLSRRLLCPFLLLLKQPPASGTGSAHPASTASALCVLKVAVKRVRPALQTYLLPRSPQLAPLHSTLKTAAVKHRAITYHGHQTPASWAALLAGSKFMLGLGDPLLGPSAVDAVVGSAGYNWNDGAVSVGVIGGIRPLGARDICRCNALMLIRILALSRSRRHSHTRRAPPSAGKSSQVKSLDLT